MTLHDTGITPLQHDDIDMSAVDAYVPPTLYEAVGLIPPKRRGTTTKANPNLFSCGDIAEAFGMIDKTRTNGQYQDAGFPNPMCCYSRRNPATMELSTLPLPDCLVGTILALLCPSYFLDVAQESTLAVRALPAIDTVFTPNAITLLNHVQGFADGRFSDGTPLPWGQAWDRATVSMLDSIDLF